MRCSARAARPSGLNKHSVVLGSWDLLVVGMNHGFQKFSRCRFESIAPPLRNVGVEGRQFGGTTYDKAPAFAFDAMVSQRTALNRPQKLVRLRSWSGSMSQFFQTSGRV